MQTPATDASAAPITKTNAFTLLTLFVRLSAVFGFVSTVLLGLAQIFLMEPGSAEWFGKLAITLIALGSIAVLVLMWIFADVIAGWALARRDGTQFESQLGVQQWQHIGFAMIGVWFLMHGLLSLGSNLRAWATMNWGVSYAEQSIGSALWFSADELLRALLGIGLMLGARGLAGLLHRLRGREQASAAPPEQR